jgi:Protein of unknown function (DUF3617)
VQKLIGLSPILRPSASSRFGLGSIAVLALLSGCGEGDGRLVAGEWQRKVAVTRFFIPGAPGTTAMRSEALIGNPQEDLICITPEAAQAGVRSLPVAIQGGSCAVADITLDASNFEGTLACAGLGLGTGSFRIDGRHAPDKLDFTLIGEVADTRLPGGMAEVDMRVTVTRVGDCKG